MSSDPPAEHRQARIERATTKPAKKKKYKRATSYRSSWPVLNKTFNKNQSWNKLDATAARKLNSKAHSESGIKYDGI